MSPRTVLLVLGTRPEAVKLAPLVRALRETDDLRPVVVGTGQHRQILDDVLDLFDARADHDLALLRSRQSLAHITTRALAGLEDLVPRVDPDVVVVQGDTTTTFTAALSAFYHRVPVAHVEAGLRSGDRWSPYPEEVNRQLTTRLTSLHLCPTPASRDNLLAESVDPGTVVVTGNTVIDALHWVTTHHRDVAVPGLQAPLGDGRRLVLVTAHRRESWEGGLASVADGLREVVRGRDDVRVVFPIHPNPVVREAMRPALDPLVNVEVIEPVGYAAFARLMAEAHVIVTDSGGVQEEAPSLGVPVLVTRENTERPEAVAAGAVELVGSRAAPLAAALTRLLDEPAEHARMARAVNPYGDGRAVERCVAALRHLLLGGPPAEQFVPAAPAAVRGPG